MPLPPSRYYFLDTKPISAFFGLSLLGGVGVTHRGAKALAASCSTMCIPPETMPAVCFRLLVSLVVVLGRWLPGALAMTLWTPAPVGQDQA